MEDTTETIENIIAAVDEDALKEEEGLSKEDLQSLCYLWEPHVKEMHTAPQPQHEDDTFRPVRVHFATNRAGEYQDSQLPMSTEDSGHVTYGNLVIKIPGDFKVDAWQDCRLSGIPTYENFTDKLGGKKVLVLVHGYCSSFLYAAKVTALLANQLNGDDFFPTLFSWPSADNHAKYWPHDARQIKIAVDRIFDYIVLLLKSECVSVHILAHSMGNRGVLRALTKIATANVENVEKIKDVIFSAPDVDQKDFFAGVHELRVLTELKINLYYTEKDQALSFSRNLHCRCPRAGLCVPPPNLWYACHAAVTLSDVSGLELTGRCHNYFIECKEVLLDIVKILQGRKEDRKRVPVLVGYLTK